MAIQRRKFSLGIRLKGSTVATTLAGEMRLDPSALKFKAYVDGAERSLVTEDQTQTMTNKTIDLDNNTLSNIETDNLKSGVLVTDISAATADTELPSALAVKTALAGQNQASEIAYDNSTSGLTAAEVQAAIDEVEGRLDTVESSSGSTASGLSDHLSDAIDAHDASAISNVASGNLVATDVQSALNELQTELDGKSTVSALDDLSDADVAAPNNNEVLTYNSTSGNWESSAAQAGSSALDDLTDVDVAAPSDGALLKYNNGTGNWEADKTSLDIDNINLNGNTISSTDTNGDLNIAPNGTGQINLQKQVLIEDTLTYINSTYTGTGSGANIGATSEVVTMTNASLVSVGNITPPSNSYSQKMTIINKTGNSVTFVNDSGGDANRRIVTGTGTDLELKDEAAINVVYDQINDRWNIVGGVGGSAGAGGINYVSNYDIEANADGYSAYADAAGVNPVDGTGGSPTITIAQSSSSPLRGTNSLLLTKDAANRQGEGFSYPLDPIADADKSKKLYISFDQDFSHANLSDGDLRYSVYDMDKGNLIRCNGEDSFGSKRSHLAWFQSDATSTNYRLIVHISSTNALAYTAKFDNIQVGPRDVSYGGILTQSTKMDTGNSWGSTALNIRYFSNEYESTGSGLYEVNSNSTDGTSITILKKCTLSVSYTSDFSAGRNAGLSLNASTTTNYNSLALANKLASCVSVTTSPEHVSITKEFEAGDIIRPHDQRAASATAGTESLLVISAIATGFAQQSEDLGNREIVVEAQGNSGDAIGTGEDIPFENIEKDTSNSWGNGGNTGNNTNDRFTVPESGNYFISGMIRTTTAAVADIKLSINGVLTETVSYKTSILHDFGISQYLNKGDTVSLRVTSALTLSTAGGGNYHYIRIVKLANPQTLLETETVAARYESSNGQTVAVGAVVKYEVEDYDTHNAFDTATGKFTAPITGFYDIDAGFALASTAFRQITIEVNGSPKSRASVNADTVNETGTMNISDKLYLIKDDEVTIVNDSSASGALNAGAVYNYVSIYRLK